MRPTLIATPRRSATPPSPAPEAAPPPTRRKTRRDFGAASAACAVGLAAQAAVAVDEMKYVAVAGDVASKPALAFDAVESKYGLRFVEYLARLLLNYDGASAAWWAARRANAAGEKTLSLQEAKRFEYYASFVSSVELSLARNHLDAAGTEALFANLDERVLPQTISAKRQLALLGALSSTPLPATRTFVERGANGTVLSAALADRGGGYAAGSVGARVVAAAPRAADAQAARLRATTRRTGRVIRVAVVTGGGGYDANNPPVVLVDGPCERRAIARAVVGAKGAVAEIVLEDGGAGYFGDAAVVVTPPQAPGADRARAKVAFDYEVDALKIDAGGSGYAEGGSLAVAFDPPYYPPKYGARTAAATVTVGRDPALLAIPIGDAERRFRGSSDRLTKLLPSAYLPAFDAGRGRYVVRELANFSRFGGEEDSVFGPRSLAFARIEEVTPAQYALLGACGAVCTAAAHVVLTPLEVVKTRIQVDGDGGGAGPAALAARIVDEEGVGGLFAGAAPIAAGYLVNGFLGFGLTELFKRGVGTRLDAVGPWAATVVGALGAAVLATTSVTPFEAAKVRMMVPEDRSAPASLVDVWRDLVDERGGVFEGLFGRSLSALVAKDLVFAAFKFAVFDQLRSALYAAAPRAADSPLESLAVSLVAGAVAGAVGAVASQPLDTTFARIETADGEDASVLGTLALIADEGGPRGLYAGVTTRALFAALLLAIEFAIFEALRDAFHVSRDDFAYALDALGAASASGGPPPALIPPPGR